jgi:GDPmannose 4,6-dehydratase
MTLEPHSASAPKVSLVTGAGGQDGYLLGRRLLAEGHDVHAVVRDPRRVADLPAGADEARRFHVHTVDLLDSSALQDLVRRVRPDELYNLAGLSSVSASFRDPWTTWETNARPVVAMLEAVRDTSHHTRFYQASSSEMFGGLPGETVVHDEDSPLLPQSPYAAAKASAHLACHVFRAAFDLRIACGIAFNHESSRRPASFLSRKVVDHVRNLRSIDHAELRLVPPLRMGNLAARRDWGFAPDYVDGMVRIARQVGVRARLLGRDPEPDRGSSYRDYVLGTGQLHAVWELVDRAFALGGFELDWDLASRDPTTWGARFQDSGAPAVIVDPGFLRPADPIAIQADPTRARNELGWTPRVDLDVFLIEMLANAT